MKLVYPACFYKEEIGYSVEVPDLKGCITQADTLEEAIEMAQDAALGWILTAIEDNEEIPKASNIENVKMEEEGFISLLLLDVDKYSKKYGSKKAVKIGINFSKTLQEALLNKIINFKSK